MPASPGTVAVTGTGFMPATVLHIHTGHGYTTGVPGAEIEGALGLGVMDASGRQWANSFTTIHNMMGSDTQRGQRSDAAVYAFHADLFDTKVGSFISMDPGGFSLSFSVANTYAPYIASLAMAGVRAHAACFAKTTTTGMQSVTGLGFAPVAVLLSSVHASAASGPIGNARWGAGASDGTTHGASSVTDTDMLMPSSVHTTASDSDVYLGVDNATPAITAEASVVSLDADGFTLAWATNDTTARQLCYWALGAP